MVASAARIGIDRDFMISQGDKISKIALVAKPLEKHLHLLLPEQEYAASKVFSA
jgi:hypothetical protein